MDSCINPTRCCYCVPLRIGAINITILWFIGSLALAINSIIIIAQQENCTNCEHNDRGYYLVNLIVHVIIFLITIFGMMALYNRENAIFLMTYSILCWTIIVCEIVYILFTITLFAGTNGSYIKFCEFNGDIGHDCDHVYKIFYVQWIVLYGFGFLISIHFATVIGAYAKKIRIEEENRQGNSVI
ncbi:hypothetical protein F8M41_016772 [Gigaspora margarita]|uniref:Uncharacterized protein n=1 Tax=Gigaspora margarita TaxID=4874 RepID=A0A8H4B308_GIGMA|nr:hypothetical protein F8M41_016772 [Gigaspora margarita]